MQSSREDLKLSIESATGVEICVFIPALNNLWSFETIFTFESMSFRLPNLSQSRISLPLWN